MKTPTKLLLLDSTTHGVVDFLSITTLLILSALARNEPVLSFVIYVLYITVAFLAQPIIGHFFDEDASNEKAPRFARMAGVTTIVLALISATYCIITYTSDVTLSTTDIIGAHYTVIGTTMVIAICNCVFHVFGGRRTYQHAEGKSTPFGLFLAPGGIGYMLAAIIANQHPTWALPFILTIAGIGILCAVFIIKTDVGNNGCKTTVPVAPIHIDKRYIIILSLLILGMVCNGIALYTLGIILDNDREIARLTYDGGPITAIVCLIIIALSKIGGGIITDKAGIKPTLIICWITLGISIVMLIIANNDVIFINPSFIHAAVIWSFTMLAIASAALVIPLRSYFTWRLLNPTPGFAFGLGGFAIGCAALITTLFNPSNTFFGAESMNIALIIITVCQIILLVTIYIAGQKFSLFEEQRTLNATKNKE